MQQQPLSEAPASPHGIRPLLIGVEAPKLNLTTVEGNPFDLNEALAWKPTVLIFYRGGW